MTFLGEGQWTPAPWLNVVADPSFGFQVSAEGAGHTWSQNSRENQLTPWSNDPVGDAPGEVTFVHDEDDCATFGPTALPIREETEPYLARYGQGYTRFEHSSHGLSLELLQTVPLDDPIKISRLSIVNHSDRRRHLSVTADVEWVLAASRGASAPFVVTEIDAETGALFARNPWRSEFSERVAFADLAGRQTSWTGDRSEFAGRQRKSRPPGGVCGRESPLVPGRGGTWPLWRAADPARARAERAHRGDLLPRGRRVGERRARPDRTLPEHRSGTPPP